MRIKHEIFYSLMLVIFTISCSTTKVKSDKDSYIYYPAIDYSDSICKVYFKKNHDLTQSYKIVFENRSRNNLRVANLAFPFSSLTTNLNGLNVSSADTIGIRKKSNSEIHLNYISEPKDENKLEKYKFKYFQLLNSKSEYEYRIALKINLYDILLYREDIFSPDTIKVEKDKFPDPKNILLYFKDVRPLDYASVFIDKSSEVPILASKCISTVDDLWINVGLLDKGIYQVKYTSHDLFFFKTIEIK